MKCVNVLTLIYAVVCFRFVFARESTQSFLDDDTDDEDTEYPDSITTARYLSDSINTKEGPTDSSAKGNLIEDATSFAPNWEQVYNFTHSDDPVSAETTVFNNGITPNERTPSSIDLSIAMNGTDYRNNDETKTNKMNPSAEINVSTIEKNIKDQNKEQHNAMEITNNRESLETNKEMNKSTQSENIEKINSAIIEKTRKTKEEIVTGSETIDDDITENEKTKEVTAKLYSSEYNSLKNNEIWKNSVLRSTFSFAENENKNETSTTPGENENITEPTTETSKLGNQDNEKGYSANTKFPRNESTQKDDVESTNFKLEGNKTVIKKPSEIESHTMITEIENKPTDGYSENEPLESNRYQTDIGRSSQERSDAPNTTMKENVTKTKENITNSSKPIGDEIVEKENVKKIEVTSATTIETTKAMDNSEYNSLERNKVWKAFGLTSTLSLSAKEDETGASTNSADERKTSTSMTMDTENFEVTTISAKYTLPIISNTFETSSVFDLSKNMEKSSFGIDEVTKNTEMTTTIADFSETESATDLNENMEESSTKIDGDIFSNAKVTEATQIVSKKSISKSTASTSQEENRNGMRSYIDDNMEIPTSTIGPSEETSSLEEKTSSFDPSVIEASSNIELNKTPEEMPFATDEDNTNNTETTISYNLLNEQNTETHTSSLHAKGNENGTSSNFDDKRNTNTLMETVTENFEETTIFAENISTFIPHIIRPVFGLNENIEKIPFEIDKANIQKAEVATTPIADLSETISTIGPSEKTSSFEDKTFSFDQSLIEVSSNIESSKTYEKMLLTTDNDNAKNIETTTISYDTQIKQNIVPHADYISNDATKLTTSKIKSSTPSEDLTSVYSTIPTVETTDVTTMIESSSTSSPSNTQTNNRITESEKTTQLILNTKLSTSTIQPETSSITHFPSPRVTTTDIPVMTEKLTEPAGLTTVITAISTEDLPRACTGIEITDYELGTGDTWINIYWELNSMPNKRCNLKINTTCSSEDKRFDEVVSPQSTLTTVEDDQPVSYLRNLSGFTNYICTGILYASIPYQFSLSAKTFRATTKKAAPSSIEVNITEVTDTSFMIEWKRPRKMNGNFKGYYILIQKKSLHYIRKDCPDEPNLKTIKLDGIDDVYFNFTMAKPNNRYKVQVVAENDVGNSTGFIRTFITDNSSSTEPLNVTSVLHIHTNHCGKDAYNATLQLNWELPCDTHGELMGFKIKIREKLYLGKKLNNTSKTMTYKIPKNFNVKDLNYQFIVEKLNASCVYEFTIEAITGNDIPGLPAKGMSNRTMDGCPSKPRKIVVHPQPSSFSLEWMPPNEYYGEILNYEVTVTESGPKHQLSKDETCPAYPELTINETTNETHFRIDEIQPNFAYKYTILAKTSAGRGEASDSTEIVALPKESEPIRNLQLTKMDEIITESKYEYKIRIDFQEPCNTNGYFRHYTIEEKGKRPGYPEVYDVINVNRTSYERILRRPEYQYEFEITAVTEHDLRSPVARKNVTTSAAIPMLDRKKINCSVDGDYPTLVKVVLHRGILNEDNGEITHYAIYLCEGELKNSSLPSSGICNPTCPLVNRTTYPFINKAFIHQITPENWNPFLVKSDITITIGEADQCSDNKLCTSLAEDTNYIVILRGTTRNTYRDVIISIKTGVSPSSASLIVIPILILIVILVFFGSYLYIKRTKFVTIFRSIPDTPIEEEPSTLRHVVPVKQFISYYNKILSDPTILRKQYEEIDEETKKYKEENVHTTFALKPENKRKNRYTNILPYDEFRVKLNIDEDDEISSDYINASYVNGITGEVEYIATQGPLEHTCRDFWKMVIQENITVIVMVSQFVEKEKEKCFKYFPKNHENMLISDDIEVKCLTELQFDTYCVRTLLIKKDIRHYSVVHMQYLDWPDFGCPSGTYNMISFCKEVRDRIQIERGLMAVHCSAGVGRTGTLISLDILLQAMKREKEISVFECVMDLRKQRTHMVQTEKQYVYIHTCLKDILEDSSLYSFDDLKEKDEHAYENIKDVKKSVKVNRKSKDIESAF